jgi:hypothetical protein
LMTGIEANQRFIKMTAVEEHVEYYDDGGEFLPLSVWAARGWDPEAIRLNCRPADKRTHAVVGDTYRVSILKSGHRGHKGGSKTDEISAAGAASSGASSSGAPPSMLAIGDQTAASRAGAGGDAGGGSDSSSSSSDSSSSRKKSKKSKKSKKETKRKEKKEKNHKKEQELKRKRDAEEAKASVSSTAYFGD